MSLSNKDAAFQMFTMGMVMLLACPADGAYVPSYQP